MNRLGRWITNKTDAPFYARKQFEAGKEIKSALAHVCGLGQFHFYINGRKVDTHELDPGWTNYRKLIEYVTFDVKEYLVQGQNMLGAEVGNGWFIKKDEHYTFHFPPFMPPNPNPYQPFGKYLVLAFDIEITYEDGTRERITADESVQVKEHPVLMSNVYGSEIIDGRKAEKDWCSAAGAKNSNLDAGWTQAEIVPGAEEPKGEMIEQFQPPVKVIHTYEGKYLHSVKGKENRSLDVYDFGQNMSGILEFDVKGKSGDVIKLYPAEKLDSAGNVDQKAKGWVDVDSCITYIIGQDDVWETCRMHFTYFAGRYVAAELIGKEDNEKHLPVSEVNRQKGGQEDRAPKIRRLKADAISSAFIKHGSFQCDDERYMQVYNIVEKAVEANMVSVHTDCPTIERFAWQEPNHLMAPSIFYMKDGKKLWEKFLLDMRTDQHTAEDYFYDMEGNKVYPGDGLMPSQCPCYIPNVLPVPGMGSFYDIIPWGSTCILGTYWHYQFYGDAAIIEDNYEAGIRYLNHLKTRLNEDGFLNHGLGDWGNPENNLARENIETAFLYADAITLAKFADILGRQKEKRELEEFASQVRDNYNEKLLVQHPQEGFWCYRTWDHPGEIFLTQAGQALPLFWGMVPRDKEEDAVSALKYTLKESGAFICGEVGLPYVIQSARKYGMNDIISEFTMRKTHPGYYAFVLDGETTLGEYWETNPRSHCHDMMGHIIEWYYNGIAGIIPETPGFSKVTVRPYLPEGMQKFVCSYQSASGNITVAVKEGEKEIKLEVTAQDTMEVHTDITNLKHRGKRIEVVKRGTVK